MVLTTPLRRYFGNCSFPKLQIYQTEYFLLLFVVNFPYENNTRAQCMTDLDMRKVRRREFLVNLNSRELNN